MSETNYVYIKSEPNLYTGGQKPSQPEPAWPPRYGKTEPHLSPEKIADEAIEMFVEYRDKHGKTEEEARAYAIQEVVEGINAIEEIKAGESEWRRQPERARQQNVSLDLGLQQEIER